MQNEHVDFTIKQAFIADLRKLETLQYSVMEGDLSFEKYSMHFEDWLRYQWLGESKDAVLRVDAVVFFAERKDNEEVLGVVGYLRGRKREPLVAPATTLNGKDPKEVQAILKARRVYARAWHNRVVQSEGKFLRKCPQDQEAVNKTDLCYGLLHAVIRFLAVASSIREKM